MKKFVLIEVPEEAIKQEEEVTIKLSNNNTFSKDAIIGYLAD